MKTKFVSLALPTLFLFFLTTISAQQRIANLHSKGDVYNFTGVDAFINAVDSAQVGDTIYLSGGVFTTPKVIKKGLSVLGAGFFPDSTQVTGKTVLGGDVIVSGTADNFYLEGVEITGVLTLASEGDTLNNFTLLRSKINGIIGGGSSSRFILGCNILGCVLVSSWDMRYYNNAFVTNSIIGQALSFSNFNTIANNLFISVSGFTNSPGYASNYNVVNNNVFLNKIITSGTNMSNNNFSNNLTISDAPVYGSVSSISPTKWEGVLQDSIFINQTGNVYDYTHNYHLQHPEKWVGTDGKEIGIYGGMFPWKEGSVPSNPHIRRNNTATQTDNKGMLQLDIEVVGQ